MTVAFGAFEGGLLKYWPDDDGACAVGQLPDEGAVSHETHRGLLLFDGAGAACPRPRGGSRAPSRAAARPATGHRCHCVTPFRGERYSLVYFTLSGHEKASAPNRAALRGNAWPTPVLARYWASVLAPPKGLNQSGIRVALGLGEEFPACIMYSGTSPGT